MLCVREFITSKDSLNLKNTLRRNLVANIVITSSLRSGRGCSVCLSSVDDSGTNIFSHFAIEGTIESPKFLCILRRQSNNQRKTLPYRSHVKSKSLNNIQMEANLMKACQ